MRTRRFFRGFVLGLALAAWAASGWAASLKCLSLEDLKKRVDGIKPGQPISVKSIRGNPHEGTVQWVQPGPDGRTMIAIRKADGNVYQLFMDQLDPRTFRGPLESIEAGAKFQVKSLSGNTYEGTFVRLGEENGEKVIYYKDANGVEGKLRVSRLDEGSVTGAIPRPLEPAAYHNRKASELFDGAPSHAGFSQKGDPNPQFTKMVPTPDGGSTMIAYSYGDAQYAKAAGKLFEDVSPASLPKGKRYTYIITDDGKMSFGMVDNEWEFGVKHAHLARGKKVVAAGELAIDPAGDYMFNLESGTYTAKLTRPGGGADMAILKSKVSEVFEGEMGKLGGYTDEVLVPKGPPTKAELAKLCASPVFLALNKWNCQK